MKSNDKISIIVPIYNLENYLESCIKSICNQTYLNIEIIAVDDGSTDHSLEKLLLLQEKDSRVKVIHKENGGVTSARLEGIKHSEGQWIGFVDGDDQVENIMYEQLLSLALDYNADISHCGYEMIFPNKIKKFYGTHKLIIQDNQKGLEDLLLGEYIEPGLCNKLYKKEIIDLFLKNDLSNIDKTIKINEDLLMNYFIFKNSKKSVYIDECFYKYIIRDESASRSKLDRNKIYDPIKVRNIICSNSNNNIKDVAAFVRLRTAVYVYLTVVVENNRVFKDDKNEVKKCIRKYYKNTHHMNKRIKLLSLLISKFSLLFDGFYRFYFKFIQKKVYS